MKGDRNTLRPDQLRNPRYNSMAYWVAHGDIKPKEGEIIIHYDAFAIQDNGVTKYLPGIKIGDGLSHLADIDFVGAYEAQVILDHINDSTRHITQQERERWNSKLNTPLVPVVNKKLILNRE